MSPARQEQPRPVGIMILPSVLTVAALCAGLTGVRFAAAGKVDLAIMLVVALTGPFVGSQISAFTNVIFERVQTGF